MWKESSMLISKHLPKGTRDNHGNLKVGQLWAAI